MPLHKPPCKRFVAKRGHRRTLRVWGVGQNIARCLDREEHRQGLLCLDATSPLWLRGVSTLFSQLAASRKTSSARAWSSLDTRVPCCQLLLACPELTLWIGSAAAMSALQC